MDSKKNNNTSILTKHTDIEDFIYTSEDLYTMKNIDDEKKLIKENICKHFKLNRDEVRLQNGNITLQGYSKESNSYINLTSTIGRYNHHVKSDSFDTYRLKCNVSIN